LSSHDRSTESTGGCDGRQPAPAAQIRTLTRQANTLERELLVLVTTHRPQLLAETGCGALTAAILIGRTAGAERYRTDASFARQAGVAPIPASSGQRNQLRLDRGGDRQLNRALHTIAITRARHDPATKEYLTRKEAEGKTKKGALRCLKRHLARRVHHLLSLPAMRPRPDGSPVDDIPAYPGRRDHSTVDTSIIAAAPMRCPA
jgi:transposase